MGRAPYSRGVILFSASMYNTIFYCTIQYHTTIPYRVSYQLLRKARQGRGTQHTTQHTKVRAQMLGVRKGDGERGRRTEREGGSARKIAESRRIAAPPRRLESIATRHRRRRADIKNRRRASVPSLNPGSSAESASTPVLDPASVPSLDPGWVRCLGVRGGCLLPFVAE